MAVKELLSDINLLVIPLMAAIGAGGREMVEWVRGRRSDAAQASRSDMEVGKALRDELLAEIARQDAKIERQDEECGRRLDAMEKRLKEVQKDAYDAAEEARSLRQALDHAEKVIAALKRQIAQLTKKAEGAPK